MYGPSVGSYQSSGKRKVHTKKKKGTITANVAGTKYEIGTKNISNEIKMLLKLQKKAKTHEMFTKDFRPS